jgi:hypothetical protein
MYGDVIEKKRQVEVSKEERRRRIGAIHKANVYAQTSNYNTL